MMFLAEEYKDEFGAKRDIIYFAFSNGVIAGDTRWDLVKVEPVYEGQILPYSYVAVPELLILECAYGRVEICFDGGETVLFRTNNGLGIHFSIHYLPHENFLDRLDGTVHAHFKSIGEFLFEVSHGNLKHNGFWNGPQMTPVSNYIDYLPGDDKTVEGYIHYGRCCANRPEQLHPFDQCVRENRIDFEEWCRKYPDVPPEYAEARLVAIYVIWINYASPHGVLKGDIMLMMRSGSLVRAMAWHQGYQAMAACNDSDLAVKFLYSIFAYQDEYGQLPDSVGDTYIDMHCTKAPFQGFAFEYVMNHGGRDNLTKEHCELLYGSFCKWIDWWRRFRDIDENGLCDYVHADESMGDDASYFYKGMPVEAPDNAAFLILLMEAASCMATKLGKEAEAHQWKKDSEILLDELLKNFWNGEKFVCRIVGTNEIVDTESIAMYQPLILGNRLPADVIEKMAAKLSDGSYFLTEGGLASESKQSPFYTIGTAFMLGRILSYVQLILVIGLYNSGQKDLAKKIAKIYCDFTLKAGLVAMVRNDDLPINDPLAIVKPSVPGNGWSSWSAAIFLILCRILKEE
jgi:hypothetical protein